jgi:hypothetical protein
VHKDVKVFKVPQGYQALQVLPAYRVQQDLPGLLAYKVQ